MKTDAAASRDGWASAALVLGGLLMVGLWLVFTTVHGPTSFNEDRLGGSMLFWGMLLGGVPNLFIAAGLIVVASRLKTSAGRVAGVGFALLLVGLIAPALIDLSIQALGAPFFLPVEALGLILLASGVRSGPAISRPSRRLLLALGILLAIAFGWALLPVELTDSVGGFRVYGALAHFVAGIAWVLLGLLFWRSRAGGGRGTGRRLQASAEV